MRELSVWWSDKFQFVEQLSGGLFEFFPFYKGEYTVGKYRIVGTDLDESILKKIYYDNAMNFIK